MEPEDADSDLEIIGEYQNVVVLAGFEELDEDQFVMANATDEDSDFEINEEGDNSDTDMESGDSDSDSDEGNNRPAVSNNQNEQNSDDEDGGDEDEEEDDVIKKILANSKLPRTHPPDINIDDFVADLSFHPDNDMIALGTMSGDLFIYKYSLDENTLVHTHEAHAKAIRAVEFNTDGTLIYTASKDKSIAFTDIETGKYKRFYEDAHKQPISSLYVVDENLFATGDDDGTVNLWDGRDKNSNPIFSLKEVDDYITAMLTNDAKKILLVTSGDGFLTSLNIGQRKLYVQSEPYEEELTCMGLFRNDSKLVVGTSKGRLYTYNWNEFGLHSNAYPGPKTPMSHMIPVTDRVAIVAGEEGILRAIHVVPGKNLGVVGQHSLAVDSMDINYTGEYIASSSDNNEVKFWNIKYFEELDDIKLNVKQNKLKEQRHNLPSSKVRNAGDFFSDLV